MIKDIIAPVKRKNLKGKYLYGSSLYLFLGVVATFI